MFTAAAREDVAGVLPREILEHRVSASAAMSGI
jgi:hypothetical protein